MGGDCGEAYRQRPESPAPAPAQKGTEGFRLGREAVSSSCLTVGPLTYALQVLVPVFEPGAAVSCRRRAGQP